MAADEGGGVGFLVAVGVALLLSGPIAAQSVCEGNYTAPSRTIHSPNFPSSYTNGLRCVSIITAPTSLYITLTFLDFNLESCCDYVEIRDGGNATSPLLGRFSGTTLPTSLRTSGHQMWITFYTDGSVTRLGFNASYTSDFAVVRLVNGSVDGSGVLQCWSGQQWSDVCTDNWHPEDTAVICTQLGHPPNGSETLNVTSGQSSVSVYNQSFDCEGNETSLSDCPTSPLDNCSDSTSVFVKCQDMRLIGGPVPNAGRVEIYRGGAWYTVCDDGFYQQEAHVVCRQLGYEINKSYYLPSAFFGVGSGNIYAAYWNCNGTERRLFDCQQSFSYCSSSEAISVICNTGDEDANQLRLMGGNRSTDGILQASVHGVWLTVCGSPWSKANSEVACRQIFGPGFSGTQALFNMYNHPTDRAWPASVFCNGTEDRLLDCATSQSIESHCNYSSGPAVMCYKDTARLVNGSVDGSGVLQYWSGQEWSEVCSDHWHNEDTAVVCTQLGYPPNGSETLNVTGGQSSISVYNQSFGCGGNEASLYDCPTSPLDNCPKNTSVFVECQASIRVVSGPVPNAGRVEIFRDGAWYTVCDDGFYQADAQVVCRQLGYQTDKTYYLHSAFFGVGSGHVYSASWYCGGTERRLLHCWQSSSYCASGEAVSVICNTGNEDTNQIRLFGGNRSTDGILQASVHGVWLTVCGYSWSKANSDVACRQLFGPGFSGAQVPSNLYSHPTGQAWLANVYCDGTEGSLLDCGTSQSIENYCGYSSVRAIRCYEDTARLVNESNDGSGVLQYWSGQHRSEVCTDNWHAEDTAVVCKQLRYPSNGSATLNVSSGQSSVSVYNQSFDCGGNETSLSDCPTSPLDNCSDNTSVFIECQASIRLVSGPVPNAGRVEIYRGGDWYTVCDDGFHQADAQVVCRQLGYQTNKAYYLHSAFFGVGSGNVYSAYWRCDGTEGRLLDCWQSSSDCSGSEAVGVICNTGNGDTNQLRLVGGNRSTDGILQASVHGVWLTVCDYSWSKAKFDVACRQLFGPGFSGEQVPFNVYNHPTGQSWIANIDCSGTDGSLLDCDTRIQRYCSYSARSAVRCYKDTVRLVNETVDGSGVLQYWSGQQWSEVCTDDWHIEDTAVVCAQLGHPSYGPETLSVTSGQSSVSVYNQSFDCGGNETSLSDCPTSPMDNCSNDMSVFIKCQASIRLADGPVPNAGRLEIYSLGAWYTVCDLYQPDAQVVCRQLGYQTNKTYHLRRVFFGVGSGNVYAAYWDCNGRERRLIDCQQSSVFCSSDDAISVICNTGNGDTNQLRLVGGSHSTNGILQASVHGVWFTVCGNHWSKANSDVTCRQLFGPGFSGEQVPSNLYNHSPGQAWLDNVDCSGTEGSLLDCGTSQSIQSYCSYGSGPAVRCYEAASTTSMTETTTTTFVSTPTIETTSPETTTQPGTTAQTSTTKVIRVLFDLTVDINPVFDENDKTSASYLQLLADVRKAVLVFLGKIKGFIDVLIVLRRGSLVVETEVLMKEDTSTEGGSDLASALIDLSATNLTISNLTGATSVAVGGTTLTSDAQPCNVLRLLGTCNDENQVCQDVDGKAECRLQDEGGPEPWKWIVGVTGGLLAIAAVGVCVFCIFRRKKIVRGRLDSKRSQPRSSRHQQYEWSDHQQHRMSKDWPTGTDPVMSSCYSEFPSELDEHNNSFNPGLCPDSNELVAIKRPSSTSHQ